MERRKYSLSQLPTHRPREEFSFDDANWLVDTQFTKLTVGGRKGPTLYSRFTGSVSCLQVRSYRYLCKNIAKQNAKILQLAQYLFCFAIFLRK